MERQPNIVLNPGMDDVEHGEWIYVHPCLFRGTLVIQIDLMQIREEFEKLKKHNKELQTPSDNDYIMSGGWRK